MNYEEKMPIIYRAQKGGPLTSDEVDGNFADLDKRLTHLEQHTHQTESIGNIDVKGDQMIITGSLGTKFGSFVLPTLSFKPQGLWQPQVPYAMYDVVSLKTGSAYVCTKSHISQDFDKDRDFWKVLIELKNPPKKPVSAQKSGCMPLYEKGTLPPFAPIGALALLVGEGRATTPLYSDGKLWRHINTNKPL